MNAADDFGFVSFDDINDDSDEFGFVPFEPKSSTQTLNFPNDNINEENINSDIDQSEVNELPKSKSLFSKENLQEIASGTGTQIALGLTQAITSPLDLLKLYLTGEGLSGLEEAQEASERMGIPFDMEQERAKFLSAMEYLPTQQLAEEWLEKETGISTQPKDRFSKVVRGLAEFAGLSKLQPKGVKLPHLESKALSTEGKALRNTAEKFGLRKFAGMEAEQAPSITPIISAEKEAKLAGELGQTSKQAIDDIISQKIPIKKMRESGVKLEDAYEAAYSAARETAKGMGDKHVDFSNVVKWIDQEIKKTKGTSVSLSDAKKAYINVLRKEKQSLTNVVKPKTQPLLYGPNGEILNKTEKAKRVQKQMTADQALNQYKDFNANVKSAWSKPEWKGSESAVIKAYGGLNDQLVKALEKANPKLADELGFANRVFHETSKLKQTEGLMKKAFSDGYNPKKLARILESDRSRKFLERNLGKDSVQDIERIAKYGKAAQEKVFEQLKNPKTIKEYLSNMTPMQLGLLVAGKGHVGSIYYLPKEAIHRIQGLIFTRNSTKKNYIQFLKDAAHFGKIPSSQEIIKSSRNLQKAIEKEFGSEESLMEMALEEG